MIKILQGGVARDYRGQIKFVNDFDMSDVKRFYIIRNTDCNVIRGWRAHRIEQRWFYVLSGSFFIDLIKIDNWQTTSEHLPVERIILNAEDNAILHVPAGHGTALRAISSESELLVFANYGIDNADKDDYTWPIDYFINRID